MGMFSSLAGAVQTKVAKSRAGNDVNQQVGMFFENARQVLGGEIDPYYVNFPDVFIARFVEHEMLENTQVILEQLQADGRRALPAEIRLNVIEVVVPSQHTCFRQRLLHVDADASQFRFDGARHVVGDLSSHSLPLPERHYGLITPIDPKNIFFMIQAGYPADFLLGLTVESLNGVRNRSTGGGVVREADAEFVRALDLLRQVQAAGAEQEEHRGRKAKVAPGNRNFIHGHAVQQVRHRLAQAQREQHRGQQKRAGFYREPIEHAQQRSAGKEEAAERDQRHAGSLAFDECQRHGAQQGRQGSAMASDC